MDLQRWRWRIAGAGFVAVGVVGAVLAALQLGAYLASGLLALVAVAGGFLLLEMRKPYSIALLAVSVLAFVFGVVGYLDRGFATLTTLYLVLALVGAVRGGQAYRAAE